MATKLFFETKKLITHFETDKPISAVSTTHCLSHAPVLLEVHIQVTPHLRFTTRIVTKSYSTLFTLDRKPCVEVIDNGRAFSGCQ